MEGFGKGWIIVSNRCLEILYVVLVDTDIWRSMAGPTEQEVQFLGYF